MARLEATADCATESRNNHGRATTTRDDLRDVTEAPFDVCFGRRKRKALTCGVCVRVRGREGGAVYVGAGVRTGARLRTWQRGSAQCACGGAGLALSLSPPPAPPSRRTPRTIEPLLKRVLAPGRVGRAAPSVFPVLNEEEIIASLGDKVGCTVDLACVLSFRTVQEHVEFRGFLVLGAKRVESQGTPSNAQRPAPPTLFFLNATLTAASSRMVSSAEPFPLIRSKRTVSPVPSYLCWEADQGCHRGHLPNSRMRSFKRKWETLWRIRNHHHTEFPRADPIASTLRHPPGHSADRERGGGSARGATATTAADRATHPPTPPHPPTYLKLWLPVYTHRHSAPSSCSCPPSCPAASND